MSPKHIGIILDGNRRFGKLKGMKPWQGHKFGAETVDKLFEWCKELDIKELTLYTLSTENLKRDKIELDFLFKLFENWFEKFKKNKQIHENRVKIRFIGDLSLIPEKIRKLAQEVEKTTENYENYKVNFCFAYGGRLELLHAFNKLKDKKEPITEQDIQDNLWLSSEPDLIIRTGKRSRTSNFLPWQSVYSEWFFLDKMWPEFTKQDLEQVLTEFKNRQRNFGQ